MSTRIASPTTASAAATVIDMSANSWPSMFCSWREKTISVRLTAFSISSIEMRMTSGLRRTSTPTVPMVKRMPPRSKNQEASSCDPPMLSVLISPGSPRNHGEASDFVGSSQVVDLLAAEVDGADRGDQQEDRGQLERIEVRGEEADRDRLHRAEDEEVRSFVGRAVLNSLEHCVDQPEKREHEQGGEPRLEPQPRLGQLSCGAEQGDHEQEQDHDRAHVHDDLNDEDELGAQQQKQDREPEHHHHRSVHRPEGPAEGE